VGPPETEWARDYESSLLPADVRFPKKGDIYESLQDIKVNYLTSWRAAFTGGGEAVLKRGEKIKIDRDPIYSRPISVYAVAINYAEVEERIVPSSDRNAAKYDGFYFSIKTIDLNENFKLVSEESIAYQVSQIGE
jgi:hypothetical protein